VGTYQDIYEQPKNVFVAGFLNRHIGALPISLIEAKHVAQGDRLGDVRVGVRPEDLQVFREAGAGRTAGIVVGKLDLPMMDVAILSIHVGEHEVHARIAGDEGFIAGERVWLACKRYHVFDKASGLRLGTYPAPGTPVS
jgi:ABC-type sugar transport system ATPase subunit